MPWPDPISLYGNAVTLVPLAHAHEADLAKAAADGDLHRLWYTTVPTPDKVRAEIDRRRDLQAKGSMLPFAVIDPASSRAVGMTTYMNIDATNRRVEIGSTWYAASVQRTGLNTECKYLLLRHAFEDIDCVGVEFRTHYLNTQSRRAIERLGPISTLIEWDDQIPPYARLVEEADQARSILARATQAARAREAAHGAS